MTISEKDWKNYIAKLAAIDRGAASRMQAWMDANPGADTQALIEAANAVATVYGEASAALACEMYDALALAQGAALPPAVPAETATYQETAKAVQGTLKNRRSTVPQTVGRLTRQAGADAILQNAARDGAEFAWIPSGDTCAFCLALASRGWQRQSKRAAKSHAEHIHPNCNCSYAVRFDGKSTVAGYEPEAIKAEYDAAEGDTPQEKINSMRRAHDAKHREEINARQREAYAERNEFRSVLEEYRKTATPGIGVKEISQGREIKNRELENFELLHSVFGGDISMPIESGKKGKKNPDYLWRGKLWEEQEPTAFTKNAVSKNVREAIHQIAENPGGVVLDIGESPMPLEEVKQIALSRLRQSSPFDCDIILIRKGSIEEIWHYRKKKR